MSKMLAFYGLSRLLGGRRRAALCKSTYCGSTPTLSVKKYWRNTVDLILVKKYFRNFWRNICSWSPIVDQHQHCRINCTKYSILNFVGYNLFFNPDILWTLSPLNPLLPHFQIVKFPTFIYHMIQWHIVTLVTYSDTGDTSEKVAVVEVLV